MQKTKKLLLTLLALLGTIWTYSFADTTGMMITLTPGWNVVSTPALLSSISFSNGGDGINFFKMEDGHWTSIIPNLNIFKPLEGFLVQNLTNNDVDLVLNYKETTDPTESIFQKSLSLGWNLLGVTNNTNPLNHIAGIFSMALDLTDDGWNNYVNHIGARFNINTNDPTVLYTPEFGEAYGVFVTSNGSVYGGVNTKRRTCTAFERLRCHLYYLKRDDDYTGFDSCINSCSYANYENEPEIGVYVKNASNNVVSRVEEFNNTSINVAEFNLYNGTEHLLRSLELSGFINPLNGSVIDVNDIIVNIEGRTLSTDEYTISESGILIIQNLEINVYGTPSVRIATTRSFSSQIIENLGGYEFNIELTKVNGQNTADFNYQSRIFKTHIKPLIINNFSTELVKGYIYAHDKGLTRASDINNAQLYFSVTKIELANIMAKYAINALGLVPDESLYCELPDDISTGLNATYDNGYTKLCQLGVINEAGNFNPYDFGTKADFGTWLSRILNHNDSGLLNQLNNSIPYYSGHLNWLKTQGIMQEIDNPSNPVVRGYIYTMLMRSDTSYTPVSNRIFTENDIISVSNGNVFGYDDTHKISVKNITNTSITIESPVLTDDLSELITEYVFLYGEHSLDELVADTSLLSGFKEIVHTVDDALSTGFFMSLYTEVFTDLDPEKIYHIVAIPRDEWGVLGIVSNEICFKLGDNSFGEGNECSNL